MLSLLLGIKLRALKKKNKVKKKVKKKKPSVTNLCSLFLLIFPPTISSTLSFQVSWSTAPWLRGNLVPFRVPTECVSSKGAAAVVGGRVAKKKKRSNTEKTSVTCGNSQTDGSQSLYFLQLRLRERSASRSRVTAVPRPPTIALLFSITAVNGKNKVERTMSASSLVLHSIPAAAVGLSAALLHEP